MTRVVHLTSVHSAYDPRILRKECASLARAGYAVTLVVPHDRDDAAEGVTVRSISRPRSRWQRIAVTLLRLYRIARSEPASIYHLHDPELIPVGVLLRRLGKTVIYDVHEDYDTSVRQKSYLPAFARPVLARAISALERGAARRFPLVLAERYYARRFPHGTLVLNYPRLEDFPEPTLAPARPHTGPVRLLYTGVVSEDRGALQHARLLAVRADVELHVIGRCGSRLADQMRAAAGSGADRLRIADEGGRDIPYQRILDAYLTESWTAGLAVFPDTPHYREKELTKLFEYMAAGIPVICSDFPAWRSLVEGAGCGLCIDPESTDALGDAVERLARNPEIGAEMGRAGRRAVEERYNWESQARNLVRLYASLGGPPGVVMRDAAGSRGVPSQPA